MKRFEWLNMVIKSNNYKKGAEIGTGKGKTGEYLLSHNKDLHLFQVVYYPEDKKNIKTRDKNILHGDDTPWAYNLWKKRVLAKYFNRITVLNGKSHEMVNKIPDNSLDFIFIDADHSYEHCLEDIKDWVPKVRKGGLISGHDYEENKFPGVVQAVNEFFDKNIKLFDCCRTKKYEKKVKYFKIFSITDDRVWYTWKK